jgi:hypothetical protein
MMRIVFSPCGDRKNGVLSENGSTGQRIWVGQCHKEANPTAVTWKNAEIILKEQEGYHTGKSKSLAQLVFFVFVFVFN